MTFGRLLLRNLVFHWRGNSAVLLGVAVGTAVLTGALLVGDSLRGSLRERTLDQLGRIDHALVGKRFVREELALELRPAKVSPVILLQGAASSSTPDADNSERAPRKVGRVTILGVDDRFWILGNAPPRSLASTAIEPGFWRSAEKQVVLNQTLAAELGARPGGTVTLYLQKTSAVPRESLLGRREARAVIDELPLKVHAVIADEGLARFSLIPSPEPPRNAFVPLSVLQAALHQEGHVNALLAEGGSKTLQDDLRKHLTLDDWGLVLYDPDSRARDLFTKLDSNHDGKLTRSEWQRRLPGALVREAGLNKDSVLTLDELRNYFRQHHGYVSLESRQLLLEPAIVEAAQAAARDENLRSAPTLVYLANRISDGSRGAGRWPARDRDQAGQRPAPPFIPYSVVAALDPAQAPPLGQFLPPGAHGLADDEIVLADWKESPLKAAPGSKITLTYFQPDEEGHLRELGDQAEENAEFKLKGRVALAGAAADPYLTPEFPGITDRLGIREWDPPFPYHNELIQKRDEDYWDEYRTTPKAYVTLAAGQKLWRSRFGQLTSIRLAPLSSGGSRPSQWTQVAQGFSNSLRSHLRPEPGGLVFNAVREHGLSASAGGTDFGSVFLGFSIFLIVAALLLVGLLFRLNLDRRGTEIGILLAIGFRHRAAGLLLLGEGLVLAVLGGLVGLAGAVLYAWLLLEFLRAWWPGTLDRSFLRLHAAPLSFLIGYGASLLVSVLTIWWAVRVLGRASPRALLAGETPGRFSVMGPVRAPRWSLWTSGLCAVLALALVASGGRIHDAEMRASAFFGSGKLLLTAGLTAVWSWMRGTRHRPVGGRGGWPLGRLGVRNAARHAVRSLLTVALLASAAFLVVAVESFHREPDSDFHRRDAGSGGFSLLAEANLPIFQDLNTEQGRYQLNFPDSAAGTLAGVTFYPFRLHAGDDASCLNLYQPRQPQLLGVSPSLIKRGGFQFQASEATTPAERANPWLLLQKPAGDAIPAFADATTAEWTLKKKLGEIIEVPNERGETVSLQIVGLLADSIFQSQLLLSEASFLKLFPSHEGYSFFLIDAPDDRAAALKPLLENTLAERGFEVTSTARRLEAYLAVENTYLATFQALGGLGLLLGALGLAVVLLRTVWERRGELALLRALGFRRSALGWLVFVENSFLLVLGLAVGAATAFLAVAPYLLGGGGAVPWQRLLGLLSLVLAVGLTAGALAMASSLRAPLLPALRQEK
jgi:ABC-type lipoprotein release transport system permease subunit